VHEDEKNRSWFKGFKNHSPLPLLYFHPHTLMANLPSGRAFSWQEFKDSNLTCLLPTLLNEDPQPLGILWA